ncbi:xaa-Pro aminopeptidase 3-like [Uranotaenia lowii]|uniref:xaa-Pro aminopeptidase 3-like n=1 Tax=Uranotaenia lowii TaxID=190385 RepID=UPI00247950A9|nr:xaa-Pro aminopeptidase 3-like [Uranotaenia lowii]XP_055588504.1 xaa-Pro aminopeptidase 3-like [Uranotaenia lowii]
MSLIIRKIHRIRTQIPAISYIFDSTKIRSCSSKVNTATSPPKDVQINLIRRQKLENATETSPTPSRPLGNALISYGQPLPETHPHLLQPGQLLPEVSVQEFQARRKALLRLARNAITGDGKDRNFKEHMIIIPSSGKKYMSDKIPYVFRQNSDFLYLSGCLEPDTVLTLEIDSDGNEQCTLFMRPKDKHAELWDGPRTGIELAPDVFGVDQAANVADLKNYLTRYSFAHPSAVVWFDEMGCYLGDIRKTVDDTLTRSGALRSPVSLVHQLRVIKSPAEIELMRKTCQIASAAINRTIQESKPGQTEHQLFAKVDFFSRMGGANHLAYPPVVAGGSNATVIHYINNNQVVRDGDMVLMDAGCEYGGYSSDITRTWPINGTYTEPQRVLYEVLAQVQQDLMEVLLKTGAETLDQLFDVMCLKIGKYLQEVGLIPKGLQPMDLARAGYRFCPHHVSHYLGMDVHDTSLISRSISMIPGMVFTVEPGIYISQNRQDVPVEFRGLGLRIEDDVLIKPDRTIEILTKACVKDLRQVESLIGSEAALFDGLDR